jgi:hypothetical protein
MIIRVRDDDYLYIRFLRVYVCRSQEDIDLIIIEGGGCTFRLQGFRTDLHGVSETVFELMWGQVVRSEPIEDEETSWFGLFIWSGWILFYFDLI